MPRWLRGVNCEPVLNQFPASFQECYESWEQFPGDPLVGTGLTWMAGLAGLNQRCDFITPSAPLFLSDPADSLPLPTHHLFRFSLLPGKQGELECQSQAGSGIHSTLRPLSLCCGRE